MMEGAKNLKLGITLTTDNPTIVPDPDQLQREHKNATNF
jgi:hypothetical protein